MAPTFKFNFGRVTSQYIPSGNSAIVRQLAGAGEPKCRAPLMVPDTGHSAAVPCGLPPQADLARVVALPGPYQDRGRSFCHQVVMTILSESFTSAVPSAATQDDEDA